MSPIPRILHALTSRSPRDLAGRAAQIGLAKLEGLGIGGATGASSEDLIRAVRRAGIDGPEALLAAFRSRVDTASLEAFRDRTRTVARLEERWPELAGRTEGRAQRIAEGRFDLLGHEGLDFGDPIDWALDPVNDRRAPDDHWSRVPYLDPDVVGDHKVVWELNRHQYLLRLGQADWLDGDPLWSEIFFRHVTDWMSANPPKRGINWTSGLEVAFRSISWLWGLHFFAHASELSPRLFVDVVACLRAHGRHVERYISTSFSPNTHLTGEALGLLYLGTMLPELPEAARWRRRGQAWLMDALEFQIRPDGGYFEQSIHYHRYTADFYLHVLLLARLDEAGAPAGLEARLEAIIDHLVSLTRADGSMPLVGDDDGGKLLFLDDRRVDDARTTILTGAVLLERPDWAAVAGPPTEELVWLLGPDALDRLARLGPAAAPRVSRGHADTGFYVMRSGAPSDEDFAFLRCGPHGALSGGHAHADALALDLSIGGRPVLVDPGTGSYTDRAHREWFRSSEAHNTVTLAGQSSSQSNGPFAWSHKANSTVSHWGTFGPLDFVDGWHDGFARLSPGLRHQRSILYIKDEYWIVRDRIEPASVPGPMRAHFQFAGGLSVAKAGETALRVTTHDGDCVATLTALEPSSWEERTGWVAPVYGRIHPAAAWASRADAVAEPGATLELLTLIGRGERDLLDVQEVGDAAWRIGDRDVLALGRGGAGAPAAPSLGLSGDFDLFWGRRDDADGWGAVFARGGTRLDLGGRLLLELPLAAKALWLASGKGRERVSRLDLADSELMGEARDAFAAWAEQV